MKYFFTILFCILSLPQLVAQDSIAAFPPDTLLPSQTAAPLQVLQNVQPVPLDSCISYLLQQQHVMRFSGEREAFAMKPKLKTHDEWLFYYLLAVFMIFGVIRSAYSKYFKDLFRVFFRTSLRVNQIREQLAQSGLPSLLFNVFFFISGGTFIFLLLRYFGREYPLDAPLLLAGSVVLTALLYSIKFVFLQLSGWLFSIGKATETYIFIVFMINKVLGVVLIPFLIFIAFAEDQLAAVMVTAAIAVVGGLFLYRFLRSYSPVRNEINVSRFHFLLYLLAFELAPLMLIYKVFTLYF